MEDPSSDAIEILKHVAAILRSLSSDQVEKLINGEAKLVYSESNNRARKSPTGLTHEFDASAIQAKLNSMSTREEGQKFLDEVKLTRESLRKLAQALDIHVARSDNVEKMRNRIIEATIGYRLTSEAVRGDAPAPYEMPPAP